MRPPPDSDSNNSGHEAIANKVSSKGKRFKTEKKAKSGREDYGSSSSDGICPPPDSSGSERNAKTIQPRHRNRKPNKSKPKKATPLIQVQIDYSEDSENDEKHSKKSENGDGDEESSSDGICPPVDSSDSDRLKNREKEPKN